MWQASGSRAVSRKSCQDSEMTSASQIERKRHHQKRKPRQRNVIPTANNKKGCRDSKMSGASQIEGKWQHQTRMSRARKVKDTDAAKGPDSQAARRRSYKLSLVFITFYPLLKLPSPGLPGFYLYEGKKEKDVFVLTVLWTAPWPGLHLSPELVTTYPDISQDISVLHVTLSASQSTCVFGVFRLFLIPKVS